MKEKMKLRALIVGYGYMGEIRHQTFQQMEGVEVVGVVDPVRVGQRAFSLTIEKDFSKALAKYRPELVFVCTPNHLIPDLCVESLEAGCHVFCEKPPGRNVADVEKMRQAEARYPRQKLMFGFNHRHHPAVQEAKAICEAGELGRILWLRGLYGKSGGAGFENSWRNDPKVSGGGILIDQGIHMLDLCRYFLGEFSEVEGWLGTHFWKIPVEDNAFVHLRNQSGQVAQVHSSATLWKHTFQMDLGLEEGYLSIRGLLSKTGSYGRETLVVGRKVGTTGRGAAGNPPEEVIYYDRDDSWKVQMDSFLACIREDKPVPESTSEDALRLMELIEKVYRIGKAKRSSGGLTPQVRPSEIHAVIDTPRMRQSVVDAEIRESEVWPEKLLIRYRQMVSQDARKIYSKKTNLRVVACPACGSRKASLRFELEGAKYRTCEPCGTWYVSPRPTPTILETWEKESAARKFWREKILPAAKEGRKERIHRPRARWVRRWLEMESQVGGSFSLCAAEDPGLIAALEEAGLQLEARAKAVLWFDRMDRVENPQQKLKSLMGGLGARGKIFATAWLCSGFDVSLLGPDHPAVNPLERLNLYTPEGLHRLAQGAGTDLVEFSTPGGLDLEVVKKAYAKKKNQTTPFLDSMLENKDPNMNHEFMSFLQSNRLSSFGRIVLRGI